MTNQQLIQCVANALQQEFISDRRLRDTLAGQTSQSRYLTIDGNGVTVRLRGDVADNWTANNPVLAQDEIGIERDTNRLKIGDGSTAWADLPYWGVGDHQHDGLYYTEAEIDGLLAAKADAGHNHPVTGGDGLSESYFTAKSASEIGYTKSVASYPHLRGGTYNTGQAETFANAFALAAEIGARLPTIEELEAGLVAGTGGGYDSQICWSASPVPGQPDKVYGLLGIGSGDRVELSKSTDTAYTRFVANATVPSPVNQLMLSDPAFERQVGFYQITGSNSALPVGVATWTGINFTTGGVKSIVVGGYDVPFSSNETNINLLQKGIYRITGIINFVNAASLNIQRIARFNINGTPQDLTRHQSTWDLPANKRETLRIEQTLEVTSSSFVYLQVYSANGGAVDMRFSSLKAERLWSTTVVGI